MPQNPTTQPGMPALGDIRFQKYRGTTIRIDGNRFTRCAFDSCTLLYAGGPAELIECHVGADCLIALESHAALSLHLLRQLGWKVEPPPGASEILPS